MKKIYLLKQSFVLSTALLVFTHYTQAQPPTIFPGPVSIGTTAAPDPSSILDVVSTSQGMLVPRMSLAQRNAILSPAIGLLIFQTDKTSGFYYFNGKIWAPVTPAKAWLLTGNSGTNPATNFIGTTDAHPLVFKINNQKAGYLDYDFNIGNVGFGYQTLNAISTGTSNTAIGFQALYSNTTGFDNTANGFLSLYLNTGDNNTANGGQALYSNTIGAANTANGVQSLYSNKTGTDNTADGVSALYKNTKGIQNTAVGSRSLINNISGNYNTALGYNAGVDKDGYNNAMALGYNATVNAENKVVVGNSSVMVIGGQVGWSVFSDGRFKTNIKENVPGLTFINKLKPVTYNLEVKKFDKFLGKKDSLMNSSQAEYAVSEKKVHTGFVAQDVEKAAQELRYDFDGVNHPQNETDNYSLVYADFVPSLVKAVQELSVANDAKDAALTAQQKINEDLQNQINNLKAMISGKTSSATTQNAAISTASLSQNIPNPFSAGTTISYVLPQTYSSAYILISDQNGRSLKQITLSAKGSGNVDLDASTLASGAYSYSLIVDRKLIDTKKMVLAK